MLTTRVCTDAADSAANAGVQPSYDGKSEYYTQDEMAAMFKPKKKKVSAPSPLSTSSEWSGAAYQLCES